MLLNSAVNDAKLANSSVLGDKIAANAVTSAKLANNAVTAAKINANAVTSGKIAANAVTEAKLADAVVTKLDYSLYRGAWVANADYLAGEIVLQGGELYQAASNLSGVGTFNATQWEKISPPSSTDLKNIIESLSGDDRLSRTVIKDLDAEEADTFVEITGYDWPHSIDIDGDVAITCERDRQLNSATEHNRALFYNKTTGAVIQSYSSETIFDDAVAAQPTWQNDYNRIEEISDAVYHADSDSLFMYCSLTGGVTSIYTSFVVRVRYINTPGQAITTEIIGQVSAGSDIPGTDGILGQGDGVIDRDDDFIFFAFPGAELGKVTYYWGEIASDGTLAMENNTIDISDAIDFHSGGLIDRDTFFVVGGRFSNVETNPVAQVVENFRSSTPEDLITTSFTVEDLYGSVEPITSEVHDFNITDDTLSIGDYLIFSDEGSRETGIRVDVIKLNWKTREVFEFNLPNFRVSGADLSLIHI